MKVRFLDDTYIRKSPRVNEDPPVGAIFAGAEIEVAPDTTSGDAILQNDRWFYDKNGWFYWSGRAEKVMEEPAVPVGETVGGMMVVLSAPENADLEPDADDLSEIPPLANDDLMLHQEDIPEGETRVVPSLEALLAVESGVSRKSPSLAPPTRSLESVVISTPPVEEERILEKTFTPPVDQPTEEELPSYWKQATPQQLNWGVQNYRIATDWWHQRNLTGKGVSVAILSTGAPVDFPNLLNLVDFYLVNESAGAITDVHGLGTQAAVVAAGTGPTVFGVAPESRLLVGKIGEMDHLLSVDGLLSGLRWAIEAGADVVAMLVDFPDMPQFQQEALQTLINQAIAQGILLVAPVGTLDNKKPVSRFPAQMEGVLSVGTHDVYGQRSNFSARSYDLDLLAPGEGLLISTAQQSTGLSMKSSAIAPAFVAGFLALVVQWYRERRLQSDPETIFNLLRETAVSRRTFNKGEDVEYGYGLLNPAEVLKRLDPLYTGVNPT